MKKIGILGVLLGLAILLVSAKPLISPTIQKFGWKTHHNSKYGHQLSLPADWEIQEWDIEEAANLKNVADGTILYQGKFFGKSGSPAGEFEILIWENKSKAPVRTWLTWFRHEDLILKNIPQEENFTIAEVPAIRYLQKSTSKKKPILYTFFGKDGKIYELTCQREDLVEVEATESGKFLHPVYDKILQSFQFVVK